MCGISGIISQKLIDDRIIKEVKAISAGLEHRGPDGENFFQSDHVFLAHRRLSIIDLKGGWQPLYNHDQSVAVIVNGEIYNYLELRTKLEQEGVVFRTGSDCEVIVHLYDKYGMNCLGYLRGMFSFCIWDSKKRKMILARDRMGEKPLYIYQGSDFVLFASEIRSIIGSSLVPYELNAEAINEFFHYHYVPEPKTVIKGVAKLPAGQYMTIRFDRWDVSQEEYWCMADAEPVEGDPTVLIREELDRIGEIIVRSDVPIGVALSGGVDSSAVAALAAQHSKDKVQAYSVVYSGSPGCDEREDAGEFAKFLGIPFQEIEINTEDMVDFFPDLIAKMNDPIADISGYGYYSLMNAANNNGTKVLLQGQGADELFWGYPWLGRSVRENIEKHSLSEIGKLKRAFKSEVRFPRDVSLKGLGKWGMDGCGIKSALHHLARIQSNDMNQLIFYDMTPEYQNASTTAKSYYASGFAGQLCKHSPSDIFRKLNQDEDVDITITRLACQTYLLENGISQADRLSMSVSVESRLPLVDYKLVELVIGLRKHQKDYNLSPKSWFRGALKDLVPDWVMNRPKRGFTPPVREWHKKIFRRYGHFLIDGCLVKAGVLSESGAKRLASGAFPLGVCVPMSFKALVLEMWLRKVEEGV